MLKKILITLLIAVPVHLHGYNKEDLARFVQTGNGYRADLRGADLAPIIKELRKKEHPSFKGLIPLIPMHRHGISLQEAQLEGASFREADVSGIVFDNATFDEKTDFTNAIFANETIFHSNESLRNVDLSKVQLQGARMRHDQIEECLGVVSCHKGLIACLYELCPVAIAAKEKGINISNIGHKRIWSYC